MTTVKCVDNVLAELLVAPWENLRPPTRPARRGAPEPSVVCVSSRQYSMTADARALLWAWAGELPPWQSDLLRRLVERSHLTDRDETEVLANISASLTRGELQSGRPLREDDIPMSAASTGSPRLIALSQIEHVGALKHGAHLDFADRGMTVIYGDNGAGKSSFARLLKQACRARVREDNIPANVFSESRPGDQTYVLVVSQNGQHARIQRRVGAPPDPSLGSISVFDSVCADHYIAKDDELSYVPREVQLVERLGRAQQTLRQRITERQTKIREALPDFSSLPAGTAVAKVLAGDVPEEQEIRRLAEMDEATRRQHVELQRVLGSEGALSEDIESLGQKIRSLQRTREQVINLQRATSSDATEELSTLRRTAEELGRAVEALGKESDDAPFTPVATSAWMSMWHAAEKFFSECEHSSNWGDVCPLCQQPLEGNARLRFRSFTSIAHGQLAQDHRSALAALHAAQEALERAAVDATDLARACRGDGEWEVRTRDFATSTQHRIAAVLSGEPTEASAPSPLDVIDHTIEKIDRQLHDLRALKDPDEKQKKLSELEELRARHQLAERLDEALKLERRKRELQQLQDAYSSLNTRRLTSDQRTLTEQLVTRRLRNELERARRDLGIRHLRVELDPTPRQVRPLVRLTLPTTGKARPEDVFSAGERRSLALAFFLAEASATDHDGTIVVDDPVSSLDAGRRLLVAMRLVEEARRRQVIVFTHDPHFLILLARVKHGARLRVVSCENVDGTAGCITPGEPWVTKPAARLADELLVRYLKDARKYTREEKHEEYGYVVEAFFKRARRAWERAVAELFKGVVEPGSFAVQTQKLHEVVVTDELVSAVTKAMTHLSFLEHDQGVYMPHSSGRHLEQLEDVVADLKAFLTLCEEARRSRKRGSA